MVDVNWNEPQVTTDVDDIITLLNAKLEHAIKHDFGADTNLPTGAIRKNPSTGVPEEWNGSTWTTMSWVQSILDHVNNTVLHQGVPTGAIIEWPGLVSPPPAGYLVCDGSAVSRTTYSALNTVLQNAGYPYGNGDRSTTFNLPDYRGRSSVGKAASGTAATLGGTFGSLNHTHSNPAHSHAVAAHSHAMDHTHTGGSHQHGQTAHTHNVSGHYHSTQGAGADIAITVPGGSHTHTYQARESGSIGNTSGTQALAGQGGSPDSYDTNSTNSTHTHGHGELSGRVGNVSGGVNGDGSFATDSGNSGSVNTASGGAVATSQIATNVSGTGVNTAAVALNTATDGATTSGTANHACIVVNVLIKT